MGKWKLATIDDLLSLYNFDTGVPTFNTLGDSWYWSSTSVPNSRGYKWVMTYAGDYVPLSYAHIKDKLKPICTKEKYGRMDYISWPLRHTTYGGAVNCCNRLNTVRGFVELIMREISDKTDRHGELIDYIEDITEHRASNEVSNDIMAILDSDTYQKAKTRAIIALIKNLKDKHV